MKKTLKVYFYKVVMPKESGLKFEELLQLAASRVADDRTRIINNAPVFLCEIQQRPPFWHGDMVRLRMSNIPVKGSTRGNVSDIDLEADEGIGEQTAFLYHSKISVLALENNRSGVSDSAFGKYFQEIGDFSDEISVLPALQPDAYARVQKMGAIQKLIIRVANVEDLSVIAGSDPAITEMIKLSQVYDAREVEVSLINNSLKSGALSRDGVLGTVKKLLKISEQYKQVKKLTVEGGDEEDDIRPVDLLLDRLQDIVPIDPGGARTLSYFIRREAVRKAWESRQGDITRMFGS